MVQRDLQLLADAACVLQVIRSRAVTVVVFPVGHVQRVYVGAGSLQENGSDRGIHTAGEAKNDALVLYLFFE